MSRLIMQQALDALKFGGLIKKTQTIAALEAELAKQQFYPDWDMLQPYHERIAELEAQLAKPEQAPVRWFQQFGDAPPRKPWVGLTEDEVNSCFEDHGWSSSAMYHMVVHAIEAKLKEKNT
jgi:hypothetical protein